jgi:pimeloyl-ACP methyl ester carboxylesterase
VQCRTWLRYYVSRAWRGTISAAAGLALPLGGWWLGKTGRVGQPTRLPNGLAVVLPGIEGRGALSWSIFQGISDGGFPGAVVLWDWTTGLWPLLLFHHRAQRRNRRKGAALARLVLAYQSDYPGQPVYLVGHSGGAAVATWAMEALPEGRAVTGTVMLGAPLSPTFPLGPALKKVQGRLWNFWSPFDLPLLWAGSLIFGTADGRHAVSAGLCGFSMPQGAADEVKELYRTRLRQRRYGLRMARQFNLGGHCGWANRVFVAETVAPLLSVDPSQAPD